MAKKLGIQTPNIDSVINIACMCNDVDYWETGRTAEKIGFENNQIFELAGV